MDTIAEKLLEMIENNETILANHSHFDQLYTNGRNSVLNAILNYGNRTSFSYAFKEWIPDAFWPTHDINMTGSATQMFYNFNKTGATAFDLAARLTECGVVLNTANCTNLGYAFCYAKISHIPTIDTRGASSLADLFNSCSGLVTIDNVILKDDGSQTGNLAFGYVSTLVNLTITGVIGQSGWSLQWSTKLSKDSITSVVNALSTTTSGLTITLSKTAVNTAFETAAGAKNGVSSEAWQALIATRSNWTISLA